MAYQRLLPGRKDKFDPLDGFVVERVTSSRDGEYARGLVTVEIAFDRVIPLPEPKWEPPKGALTFATVGIERARDACRSKAHVLIREDPMFGKRGWAKEVIDDVEHGFLVLVVVFSCKKNGRGEWEELMRPGDNGRRFWRPDKVEFA